MFKQELCSEEELLENPNSIVSIDFQGLIDILLDYGVEEKKVDEAVQFLADAFKLILTHTFDDIINELNPYKEKMN